MRTDVHVHDWVDVPEGSLLTRGLPFRFCTGCDVEERTVCEWYALCTNDAAGVVAHPVLGPVPTCTRCAGRHELKLESLPS